MERKIPSNLILKVWIISVKLIPHMTWYHASWLRYGCLKFLGTSKFSPIFKISNANISAPRGRNSKILGGLIYLTWGHFWAKFEQFWWCGGVKSPDLSQNDLLRHSKRATWFWYCNVTRLWMTRFFSDIIEQTNKLIKCFFYWTIIRYYGLLIINFFPY